MLANTHINNFVKVFNNICESGIYPNYWKNTKVALIPKEEKDLSSPSSYYPICLLPIWAKVFDRIVTRRLCSFLETNNLLNENQFGFRKNSDIIDALFKVKDIITNNMNNDFVTCLISFDMSNAFN